MAHLDRTLVPNRQVQWQLHAGRSEHSERTALGTGRIAGVTAPVVADGDAAVGPFRHEALLYEGLDDFVVQTAAFLREGILADEASLVVVAAHKIAALREELGDLADAVCFADMAEVGANPGRIIPAWQDFVSSQGAAVPGLRGIGEPIWAERSPVELTECQRHEALLNVAFAGSPTFWLACPYDLASLDESVINEATRSHPFVAAGPSGCFGVHDGLEIFAGELPPPPGWALQLEFGDGPLGDVRAFVYDRAGVTGLDGARLADLMVAVTELASNTVRHGGGRGTLRVWEEEGRLVCDVRDRGRITDPMVGRRRPTLERRDGRGLWLVQQLCDLVQIRSGDAGTTVRIHMGLERG
jgi:anti-sigma regulatory factor (Ser/Thr protein kinase)